VRLVKSGEKNLGERSLKELAQIAQGVASCERCPLYIGATQAVVGEGPAPAAIMMVGEQPGDQEDRAGRPFVGPAGGLLDRALKESDLDRSNLFVTNVVKHFKHEQRGKRRIHKQPSRYEVQRCRWWLDQEMAIVKPKLVVALGATAAREIAGRPITMSRERGRLIRFGDGRNALATVHPAAILRIREETSQNDTYMALISDLKRAKRLVEDELL
jgi:uracil-DNA glycosylase family protein